MSTRVKVAGAWQTAAPYLKASSTWRLAKSGWVKVAGTWTPWFLQGGLNNSAYNTYDTANRSSSSITDIAVQSDGKVLLCNAILWNGFAVNRFLRLNSDATRDTAFSTNLGTGPNSVPQTVAIQSDGKILVGGGFSQWNGTTVNYIVRLNSDGTRDTTFNTNLGTGFNNTIQKVVIQSDGKILVGGFFTTVNGATVNRIVRLNSDGTRDTTFTTNAGTAANNTVNTITLQSDGKILVGGDFTTWNAVTVNRIVRLNSDGTRDTTFTTNAGTAAASTVSVIRVQSDSKILVGGAFTTWNAVTVNRIVRLNSDGTRDTAFTTNTGTAAAAAISAITVQSDGKILVGGSFTAWNGTTVGYIVQLNSDGTRNTTFTTNTGTASSGQVAVITVQADGKIIVGGTIVTWNGYPVGNITRFNADGTFSLTPSLLDGPAIMSASGRVAAVAFQADGKMLLGGEFTVWNAVVVNRIVRVSSNGTRDTTFTTNTGTAANNTVRAIAVQSDGKILVGGDFTTWNGVTVNRIVRLNSDGTRDTTFTTNTGSAAGSTVNAITTQSDGKILVGGDFTSWNGTTVNFIVRLNSDGTRDTTFTTNTGTAADGTVKAIAVQSDGKILVGGTFFTWNGASVGCIVRLNSDGTRDTAFTTSTGTGADNTVNTIALQSDGKILLGGTFNSFDSTSARRCVRLNSTGTMDFGFNIGTAANTTVNTIAVQSDGKILVGGNFTTWNGTTVSYIVRLNSDGTRDTAFTTNAGTGFNINVSVIAVTGSGLLVVGGSFSGFNGINRSYNAVIGGDVAV